jgi:hypothetical protein
MMKYCRTAFSRRISLLLVLVLILTACRGMFPSPTTLPTVPTSHEPVIAPTEIMTTAEVAPTEALETPGNFPTRTAEMPFPRYILDVLFDYTNHTLSVGEVISYTNRSGENLTELVLMVDTATYPGTFDLKELLVNSEKSYESSWEKNILRLELSQPLLPGEMATLSIQYALNLPSPVQSPETRPVPFGYSARQTNLVDWYPFIAPYVPGKGWLAHAPSYYGEHLVYETADFEVTLHIQDERPDLVIAASARDEPSGKTHHYQLTHARNFTISISHTYQVFQQEVDGITINSYAFPEHAAAGEQVLQTTVEALKLYQRLFGEYQHTSLSVVEADFLDGMEYDGLYFLSNGFYNLYQGTAAEYLVAIAAHETAHQWWYGSVANDQALEPWLDEALCTYNEAIFYEQLYPDALNWWWTYRVDYYEPQGWVDTTIYNPEGVPNAYSYYRGAVYLNGAHFLKDLRSLVGDEAFFAFLKEYANQYRETITSSNEFFSLLENYSQEDLSALINHYFKNQ